MSSAEAPSSKLFLHDVIQVESCFVVLRLPQHELILGRKGWYLEIAELSSQFGDGYSSRAHFLDNGSHHLFFDSGCVPGRIDLAQFSNDFSNPSELFIG